MPAVGSLPRPRSRWSIRALPPYGLTCLLVAFAATAAVPASAQSRLASAPPPSGGAAPRSARVTFYFGLKRPEAKARSAFFSMQRPGSPSYRRFMALGQIAERYGAGAATRGAFVRDIARLGLTARIDPSGVFARVTGSVGRFERAFGVRIDSVFSNDPNVVVYFVHDNGSLPMPAQLRPLVDDVVATYAHAATPSGTPTARETSAARKVKRPRNTGTWTRGCGRARATGGYSFGQVRHAYGIDRLGAGNGASVAILNIGEGVLRADIADNARCFGYPTLHARTLLTDGQSRAFGRSTFEPAEDLDVVRGTAPGLRSLEFSQVWLSPQLWFLGVSQVLDAAHLPDSLSISYGECERSIRGRGSSPATRAGANLMDSLFVRLGLAGVGAYAASGDEGSTCAGRPFQGVAWPASSPYVTAVGGSRLTLNRANQRTGEVAWNDLKWLSPSRGGGAGGGGYSIASPRPPFQDGLRLTGKTRAVPDVAAVASNLPGWPVVFAHHWVIDGGTSGATPLIATATAILSADQRRHGQPPIGPPDGLFYELAGQQPSSFWDIVHGDNRYLSRVPWFRAKRGYDLASGLGIPRFSVLASRLPRPAPSDSAR
jgi:subtilase family serine protease